MHTLIPLLLLKSHAILPTVYYYLRAMIFSRSYPHLVLSFIFLFHPPSSIVDLAPFRPAISLFFPPFRANFLPVQCVRARNSTLIIWREAGEYLLAPSDHKAGGFC